MLSACGFKPESMFTSVYEEYKYGFLLPIRKFQYWQLENRADNKGGMDYRRINRVLLSKELLLGPNENAIVTMASQLTAGDVIKITLYAGR